MKKLSITAFALVTMAVCADAPAGVQIFTGMQLKGYTKSLAPKVNAQKVATEQLAKWSTSLLMVAHREGDGEAELHLTQADVMIIQTGSGTLKTGGTVDSPRNSAANEVRGPSITGGEEKKVGAGDIIHIPAKVPHQMRVASGQQITYAVVKVDEK